MCRYKCRYIIENINGLLKHYKALDHIKNTQIGHIFLDYKIACSMINFKHKNVINDDKDIQMAKDIKTKAKIIQNNLEFILNKRLDTKLLEPIALSTINNFSRLKKKQIKYKLAFGPYKLKQCLSYLGDLIKSNKAYIATKHLAKTIANVNIKEELLANKSKIIAVEINSRHQRSEKKDNNNNNGEIKYRVAYKVFLYYSLEEHGIKSIKGNVFIYLFIFKLSKS